MSPCALLYARSEVRAPLYRELFDLAATNLSVFDDDERRVGRRLLRRAAAVALGAFDCLGGVSNFGCNSCSNFGRILFSFVFIIRNFHGFYASCVRLPGGKEDGNGCTLSARAELLTYTVTII